MNCYCHTTWPGAEVLRKRGKRLHSNQASARQQTKKQKLMNNQLRQNHVTNNQLWQNHITKTVRRTAARNQKRHKPHAPFKDPPTTREKEASKKPKSERQRRGMKRHREIKPTSITRYNSDAARGPDDNFDTITVHVSTCIKTNLKKNKQTKVT